MPRLRDSQRAREREVRLTWSRRVLAILASLRVRELARIHIANRPLKPHRDQEPSAIAGDGWSPATPCHLACSSACYLDRLLLSMLYAGAQHWVGWVIVCPGVGAGNLEEELSPPCAKMPSQPLPALLLAVVSSRYITRAERGTGAWLW